MISLALIEPGIDLLLEAGMDAVRAKSEAQSEVEQLRRELAKVKMERYILKKALGYFAKDPM